MSHGKWRDLGSAEGIIEGLLPGPQKHLVENVETGEQRIVLVNSGEDVGDAIAAGRWADDD